MKSARTPVVVFLILSICSCTTSGTFSIKSSNPASEIYVEDSREGTGIVGSYTTENENLNVTIKTPDHDDLNEVIAPDYISDAERSEKPPYEMSASQGVALGTLIVGPIYLFIGFLLQGIEMDDNEEYVMESDSLESIFLQIGGVITGIGVPFLIDSLVPKPEWKDSYSFDVSSLSHFDAQGYNRKTGFNKFGVNRSGQFEDGSSFSGRILNGVMQGFGTWTTAEGDEYKGTFTSGKLGGFAASSYADGSEYFGFWSGGEKNGAGVLIEGNRQQTFQKWYMGELTLSEPHEARITGSRYNWIFLSNSNKDGLADGSGNAITADGSMLIESGIFSEGELVSGKMIFPDGTKYEGRFNGDLFIEGRIVYSDGRVYEGDLNNGAADGLGKMTFSDGTVYVGEFRNGNYNGEGKIVKSNGESFEGSFVDGKPHGSGIFFKDGRVERCEYYQGERIDQAYLIRQENEKQLAAIREERILIAKERQDREEQQRLEKERQEAERKKRESQASDDSFFGALLVGGATALIGGSAGLSGGDVLALSAAAATDAYKGDSSMSGMKATADVLSGGKTNLSGGSSANSGSRSSSGVSSMSDLTGIKWQDIPGKTDLYFDSSSGGRIVMHDVDGQGAAMTTYFNISSVDYNSGTMTYSVDHMEFRSSIHGDYDKDGDRQPVTASFRIDGRTLYWDNRTFTR